MGAAKRKIRLSADGKSARFFKTQIVNRCANEPFAIQRGNHLTVHASPLWLPSQNGAFLVCLQPHHATVLASVISVFNGAKPVPLCEPSQNGWLLDWPQLHQ